MPIKYGELTIIYNKEQIDIFTSLLLWLEYQEKPLKESKYIFLFDDGEICDTNDKYKDLKFYFCDSRLSDLPIYFEKSKEFYSPIYFKKKPILKNNDDALLDLSVFDQLFSSFSKYEICKNIQSVYNGIYYRNKNLSEPEVFGIMRIKSNGYMPRFQFAYDSDEFTKEEIVYLINYIFNKSN